MYKYFIPFYYWQAFHYAQLVLKFVWECTWVRVANFFRPRAKLEGRLILLDFKAHLMKLLPSREHVTGLKINILISGIVLRFLFSKGEERIVFQQMVLKQLEYLHGQKWTAAVTSYHTQTFILNEWYTST